MRTLRLTADIITERLPGKGAGDVVTVDDDFAEHLLSLGVALDLKVQAPVNREPILVEKKTPGLVSQPALVSPERTAKRRGRPPKGSLR